MYTLFQDRSNTARRRAQDNLSGRTHYADPDTLKFHHARITDCHITDHGLLLCLVESVSLDMNNTRRGFRHAVFNVFGTVLDRPDLEHCHNTRKAAVKAMWTAVNAIDAQAHTVKAIEEERRKVNAALRYLAEDMARACAKAA